MQVQDIAAKIDMGNVLFLSIPSIFMVIFLGPWTDTGGRRPALLAPPVGSAIEAILILLIMYLEWPVYILFVGEAINGFSGFVTIMTMAAFAYVADINTEKGLAIHIGLYILLQDQPSRQRSPKMLSKVETFPKSLFRVCLHTNTRETRTLLSKQ